jgi:hypothetical protein
MSTEKTKPQLTLAVLKQEVDALHCEIAWMRQELERRGMIFKRSQPATDTEKEDYSTFEF